MIGAPLLSTKKLRYFDAVARLGHFGRAAELCGVTQPALSMQILDLERELGLELIERRSTGMALTGPGREVALRASKVLMELRDIEDYVASCKATLSAPVRLGVIPTVAPYLLPQLLALAHEHYPGLALQIRETHTQTLVTELKAGSLDVLVLALPLDDPEIESSELLRDRFLLAVPAERSFAPRVRVSPDLIRNDRLLLLEEGHCLRDQALAVCELPSSGNSATLGVSSLSTVVQMVASGLGLTLLPEISLRHETMHRKVKLVRFADPEPRRTLGLAWRKSSPRGRDFAELGRLVKKSLQRAAATGPVQ